MAFSTKIVGYIQPLNIFTKHFMLGVSQGYEYVSDVCLCVLTYSIEN